MNAIIDVTRYSDVKPVGKKGSTKKQFSLNFIEKWKFDRIWFDRNYDKGDVVIDSLEVDYIEFEQDYLVQESKDLIAKLKRIGFEQIVPKNGFDFVSYYYNKKHNVSIALYEAELKDVIYKAEKVVKDSQISGDTANAVFVATVNVFR